MNAKGSIKEDVGKNYTITIGAITSLHYQITALETSFIIRQRSVFQGSQESDKMAVNGHATIARHLVLG